MKIKIAGTGSALPRGVLTNDQISTLVDTSDEWISSRTGIRSRHIVNYAFTEDIGIEVDCHDASSENAMTLAEDAARKALESAGMNAEDLDLIIVSTLSAEQFLPCVACNVQEAISAKNAVCFDVNSACTGFITAYQIAAAQMRAGMIENALIIGAESLSHLLDWQDRGTCILFGDGAGAAIITIADLEGEDDPIILHADGSKGGELTCGSGHGGMKSTAEMNGREIFRFAVKNVPKVIREIAKASGHELDEIDYIVLHQANLKINEAIAKRLKLPFDRFPSNIANHGNMSSACIPVLLDELNRSGKLKTGTKLILAGFGGGLTWGGTYLTWKE